MALRIVVYGMEGCGFCHAAVAKLIRFELPHVFVRTGDPLVADGREWMERRLYEVKAAVEFNDGHFPVVCVDGRWLCGYEEFTKWLAGWRRAGNADTKEGV